MQQNTKPKIKQQTIDILGPAMLITIFYQYFENFRLSLKMVQASPLSFHILIKNGLKLI